MPTEKALLHCINLLSLIVLEIFPKIFFFFTTVYSCQIVSMCGNLFCGQLGISSISELMIVELNCKVTQSTYWKCHLMLFLTLLFLSVSGSFASCYHHEVSVLLSFLSIRKGKGGSGGAAQEELQKYIVESPKGLLQSQIISSIIFNQATRTHIVIIFHIFLIVVHPELMLVSRSVLF